jgi:methionyl-tRNA formyltransferase
VVTAIRIVFFGTPQFAVPTLQALLDAGHIVCGVVTQPDRPRGRGQHVTESPVKQVARERQLPIAQPARLRDPGVPDAIAAWAPDLGVVVAYGQIIPASILDLPRLGLINVHGSLLPAYRGAAPVHRAVMHGDTQTGVTIMRVAPRLDAGAMFASATRPIAVTDTSEAVERDLSEMGARLLVEVVARIATGTATETPQDESLVTYAPKLTKAESALDWTKPAAVLHNQVRGLQPWPHASTHIDGTRLIVLESAVVETHDNPPAATSAAPGTILHVERDAIHVAAGGGTTLALLRIQPEGKRPMAVRDYLAGTPLRPGQRFTDA